MKDQRRISVYNNEFVVLDETGNKVFHGHVRSWEDLSDTMQRSLVDNGLVNARGKIL